MEFAAIVEHYTELFDIIFTFTDPIVKLTATILGLGIGYDVWWIVHQVRKNAQSYEDGGSK